MASASSQTTFSSASDSTPPTKWDAFLSFRGTDTRYKFTSHLYAALDRHGVRPFKDDPELPSGEVISEALFEAIHESRCHIVIFSENYASSPWCLDELVEIYHCHKTMARLLIPVFYYIDPSTVRHQIGSFKEAFEKHEIRFSGEIEKVKKWRLTLTEVANFSGEQVSKNRSEADIINKIVDKILLEIDPKTLDVAKYPVGLDTHVKDITKLLSNGTNGVIRFGIYGMGGVGKTTLAKALYNQLLLGGSFKDSCFLANCRELSVTAKGLVSLQQQLINDVLKCKKVLDVDNVDKGIKLIGARLCSTKVLVVIDDLDHHKQFEYLVGPFAPGSVVIITTRDKELLDKIDVEPIHQYRVTELDDDKSLTLFTRHAFGNAEPSSTLMVLTREILRHAGGLPLALEIYGSYMYKRPEAGWKSFIKKLQHIPDSTIRKRLIISLDALESDDPMLKKLFLDIACYLIGIGKNEAVKLLETYYSDAEYNIGILKNRCLLRIDSSNRLRMHDLLRDMGREVSRNNSPNEPGKHSRLWAVEDISDVLKKQKGTEVIEVIIPRSFGDPNPLKGISFTTKTFKRMGNLRFLLLADVKITGSFAQKLEDLRWLSWKGCPLKSFPSEFYPQKLVFLALRCSKLRTMQGLKMVFKNLKDLDMSGSVDLTTTPDFTKLPCLEILNLRGCRNLKEVPISIGILVKLVFLNLSDCVKLKRLPNSLCNLRSLEILNISGCKKLEMLPDKFWNLTSLRELNAGITPLKKVPDMELSQIASSSNLKELNLGGYRVTTLPCGIAQLSNLTSLRIRESVNLLSIEELPPNLKLIDAYGCTSLERLPDLSDLKHLEELDLTNCISLREIQGLTGCSLTQRFFQVCSGYRHPLRICTTRVPDWIPKSKHEKGTIISLDMYGVVSNNVLALILCFKANIQSFVIYSVRNTTYNLMWTDCIYSESHRLSLVMVPRRIFLVGNGDSKIEVESNSEICGMRLLY